MDHNSSAMRLAVLCVISLVGYWAFIEAENYDPNAGPTRVVAGQTTVETCGNWSAMFGLCQSRSAHVRADTAKTITNRQSTN